VSFPLFALSSPEAEAALPSLLTPSLLVFSANQKPYPGQEKIETLTSSRATGTGDARAALGFNSALWDEGADASVLQFAKQAMAAKTSARALLFGNAHAKP
jgi:hypothetical protein